VLVEHLATCIEGWPFSTRCQHSASRLGQRLDQSRLPRHLGPGQSVACELDGSLNGMHLGHGGLQEALWRASWGERRSWARYRRWALPEQERTGAAVIDYHTLAEELMRHTLSAWRSRQRATAIRTSSGSW